MEHEPHSLVQRGHHHYHHFPGQRRMGSKFGGLKYFQVLVGFCFFSLYIHRTGYYTTITTHHQHTRMTKTRMQTHLVTIHWFLGFSFRSTGSVKNHFHRNPVEVVFDTMLAGQAFSLAEEGHCQWQQHCHRRRHSCPLNPNTITQVILTITQHWIRTIVDTLLANMIYGFWVWILWNVCWWRRIYKKYHIYCRRAVLILGMTFFLGSAVSIKNKYLYICCIIVLQSNYYYCCCWGVLDPCQCSHPKPSTTINSSSGVQEWADQALLELEPPSGRFFPRFVGEGEWSATRTESQCCSHTCCH